MLPKFCRCNNTVVMSTLNYIYYYTNWIQICVYIPHTPMYFYYNFGPNEEEKSIIKLTTSVQVYFDKKLWFKIQIEVTWPKIGLRVYSFSYQKCYCIKFRNFLGFSKTNSFNDIRVIFRELCYDFPRMAFFEDLYSQNQTTEKKNYLCYPQANISSQNNDELLLSIVNGESLMFIG